MATRTRETDALSESAEQRAALITKAGRRAAIAELPRGTHHQANSHHQRSPAPSRGKLHTKLPPSTMLPEVPSPSTIMKNELPEEGYASVAMRRRTLSSRGDSSRVSVITEAQRFRPKQHYLRSTVYNEDSLLRLDEGGRAAKRDKAVLREGLSRDPAAREERGVDAIVECLQRTWPRAKELDGRALRRCTRAARLMEAYDGQCLPEPQQFCVFLDGRVDPPHKWGEAVTVCTIRSMKAEFLSLRDQDVEDVLAVHRETERRRAFDTLKNVPLFRRWSKSKVHKICQMLTFHYLRRGDRVVRQGEATDNVYFLLDGGCLISRHRVERGKNSWPTRVSKKHPVVWQSVRKVRRSKKAIGRLGAGDTYGASQIMKEVPCGETVTCTEPSTLVALNKVQFRDVLDRARKAHEQAQRDPRVNTSGHPSADELLAAVAAIDNPENAGPPRALTRPPTAQTPNPLRWRSVDDDDASLLSKGLEIDSRLRYHRHRAEKVGFSLGDDASILSVRRGRDALKRERASQVDLRRQEQARARRRGDFPEVRRIQGMIDEINDEATFVNVDFAADEGSYGSYGDDLSCVTFDTLATAATAASAPRRPRPGVPPRRRARVRQQPPQSSLQKDLIGLRTRPRGGFVDAVQANARKHAGARRRARRRRDLTYEKRREDAFEWGLDHAVFAV